MRDYLTIGEVPSGEDCEQLGSNYDGLKARAEHRAFINQLRRAFGPEPEGADLRIKSFPHDFGTYSEVVCYFDDNDEEAVNYAFKCEGETPEYWDSEALEELKAFQVVSRG